MIRIVAFAPLALILLAACATLSEDQCHSADWYEIGKSDGSKGRKDNYILEHAKACNEYGIKPIASEWRKGRTAGLPLYCTPERAYSEGKRGQRLSPVCPAEDLRQLRRANSRGLAYHEISEEMDEIEDDIKSLDREIASLAEDDPARASLLSERRFLRLEYLSLRADLARYRRF